MSIAQNFTQIASTIPSSVTLCAVSKFHPKEAIEEVYALGHRVFGESRPQELALKAELLPQDIEWHFIGHLQTNKAAVVVKYASLIESVDSHRLLSAISKEAQKAEKRVKVLLQMHIASEESKQGFSMGEIEEILASEPLPNVEIVGLMGMASYTDDMEIVRGEFMELSSLYNRYPTLSVLSMGMSGDYTLAIECGSTNVRIGSSIFGSR